MAKRARRPSDQTFGSRIGYRIDRFLSLHPVVQLGAVLGAALVLSLVFGACIWALDDAPGATYDQQRPIGGLGGGLFWAVTRMLDGGTVANDAGLFRQVFGVGVTLVGLVAVALITGAFASSFSERLAAIRRGTVAVFEQGHIVVLGWNVHAGVILRELAMSRLRVTLVVVADHDRELLEEQVREQLEGREHHLDVVIRRGDPTTTASVRRAAVRRARAVVILPDVPRGVCVDRAALRSLLAVERVLGTRRIPSIPVIVEVATPTGRELVRLADGAGEVVVVEGRDLNARLIAKAVRRRGAFDVAQQILSLDARSVFLHPPGALAGRTFDAAHAAIDTGVLIGIARAGKPLLSPPGALTLAETDRLLVFSDHVTLSATTGSLPAATPTDARVAPEPPLRVLVLRYRADLPEILAFLDRGGPIQATVMVAREEAPTVRAALACLTLSSTAPASSTSPTSRTSSTSPTSPTSPTSVEVLEGDPALGAQVERALDTHPDVVLLLAPDVAVTDAADADADQLITLLHLRRAGRHRQRDRARPRVVVEFRGPETKRLARPSPDREDFILKRETVGLLLAQELHAICLQERAGVWVGPVYDALLQALVPSIELAPMDRYAGGAERPTFAELAAAARARGQVAIGVAEEGATPWLLPSRDDRFDAGRARLVLLSP